MPFKIKVLAATAGKSLNNRIYTPELLNKAHNTFLNKPFIMDHDYQNCDKVLGVWNKTSYGKDTLPDGTEKDGMWFEGVGLMQQDLFDKVAGKGSIPPLIKGISIGGDGAGEMLPDGTLLKELVGCEGSLTAFPGIPEAQVAQIERIYESYGGKNMSEEKPTNIDEVVTLEEAEKQAAQTKEKITEADIPTSPDSIKVTPPTVAGTSPTQGGPQAGGHAEVPPETPETPAPPPTPVTKADTVPNEPEGTNMGSGSGAQTQTKPMPKVVDSKSVSTGPGENAPFQVMSEEPMISERARDLLKQMDGNAKHAYWKMAIDILRQENPEH